MEREDGMLLTISVLAKAGGHGNLHTVLWVAAAVLVIAGVFSLFRGAVVAGIVLIILGLLIGPGGVSIFT